MAKKINLEEFENLRNQNKTRRVDKDLETTEYKHTSARLPKDLWQRAKMVCVKKNLKMKDVIPEAIEIYITLLEKEK